MQILTDLHCHTVASTHAFSTVKEIAEFAKKKGLQAVAITDHGPSLPDGAHLFHFQNLWSIPRKIDGVTMLSGAECSITDSDGGLDLSQDELLKLDIVIASIHTPVYYPKTYEEHTNVLIKVIENPCIDILGHLGRSRVLFDEEKVALKAKKYDKLIEINSHTLDFGGIMTENCKKIALACKKHNVPIAVNSDSHICYSVGDFEKAINFLNEINFDENLIMNSSLQKLLDYFKKRKNINI